jgi:hypothetical protein
MWHSFLTIISKKGGIMTPKNEGSNPGNAYKQGQQASQQDQNDPHTVVSELLDTDEDRAARQRGFENEEQAKSIAKKQKENDSDEDDE